MSVPSYSASPSTRVESGLGENDDMIVKRRRPFALSMTEKDFSCGACAGRQHSSLPPLQHTEKMQRAGSCSLTSSAGDIRCFISNKNTQQDQRLYNDDECHLVLNSENTNIIRSSDHADYSHVVPDEDYDHYELHHHQQHPYYYSELALGLGVGRDATAPSTTESKFEHLPHPFSGKPPHEDAVTVMINSKTSNSFSVKRLPSPDHDNIPITVPAAASDFKHLVVPHHDRPFSSHHYYCTSATHDRELLASKHHSSDPKPNLTVPHSTTKSDNTNKAKAEAEAEAAIVPSLSDVCSNDLPSSDQNQNQSSPPSRSVDDQKHDQQARTNKLGSSQSTPCKRKYSRTRTTEVHNLSERKQRDKIKKKMRTLRGLLPNCNKADKASILDEAIVYVKTLQLQLQMMSMGAGLMPPMMVGNGRVAPHLTYMPATSASTPTFQMLSFAPAAAATPSFVPFVAPSLLVPHPCISLSTSMNSNPSHQPKHDQHHPR